MEFWGPSTRKQPHTFRSDFEVGGIGPISLVFAVSASEATTQSQSIRDAERGETSPLPAPDSSFRSLCTLAVGPSALPCAGGHPPQRPPPEPCRTDPCVVMPAVRLFQSGGHGPKTLADSLKGSWNEVLVKTDPVCGLEVAVWVFFLSQYCFSYLTLGRSRLYIEA